MPNHKKSVLSIGITGHRNLSAEQLTDLEPLIRKAIFNIITYYKNLTNNSKPEIIFTSPLAIGADTLFAKIAMADYPNESLLIYLPFEKEEYLKDFTTEESKEQFENILKTEQVKKIQILNNSQSDDRNILYLNLGKKIVEDNDYLIAVWDEQQANGLGGTGDIVGYARSLDKNILVINPGDTVLSIKANYLPQFESNQVDELRPAKSAKNLVEGYYNSYDAGAIENQRLYKQLWQTCFWIGLGVALILAIKVAFEITNAQFYLTVLEILLLIIVIALIIKEKRHSYHSKYLKYRFIAENFRINQLFFYCGFYPFKFDTKVIHKTLHELEILPAIAEVNKIIILTSYCTLPVEEKKKKFKDFVIGQNQYHSRRKQILSKRNKTNVLLKKICIAFFAAILLCHGVLEFLTGGKTALTCNKSTLEEIIVLFYLFVPAMLAKFEAEKYLNEWERLITQSNIMHGYFETLEKNIDTVSNDGDLHALLNSLGENMYWENLDWEMFMKDKNETIT